MSEPRFTLSIPESHAQWLLAALNEAKKKAAKCYDSAVDKDKPSELIDSIEARVHTFEAIHAWARSQHKRHLKQSTTRQTV